MAKAKAEKKQLPTLEESSSNPYKRFLALGSVLGNALAGVQNGDLIGIAYLGQVDRDNAPSYHNYNVKVQKGASAQRIGMADMLKLKAEDIMLQGTEPLIGIVVDCGTNVETAFGPAQSITVCLNLEDIRPEANNEEEPF